MYNKEIYQQVSSWMEEHKEAMIHDIQRISRIPSISDSNASIKPFGSGCRAALDLMLQIGEEHGFYTENYEYYVGSIGEKEKDWDNMVGFWNHLDVVPVGEDWEYPPFEAVRKGDLIIGRGAQDNKGPAVGLIYVMECIRELKLPVNHQLCLFVGCDEEQEMRDLKYYIEHYKTPVLSMIADCGFPVCYGEKGIYGGTAVSLKKLSNGILDFSGGSAVNMIPGKARIVLKKDELPIDKLPTDKLKKLSSMLQVEENCDTVILTAAGNAGHSAFPEGSVNAIFKLCEALKKADILKEEDSEIIEAVYHATSGYYGEEFGINYQDDISGKLTCVGTVLSLRDGHAELTFNIRYSITADGDEIGNKLASYWNTKNFEWKNANDSKPNYFDPSHPAVERLTDVYNEITGSDKKPYTMGGGTYARKLPRAFGFGIGGMPPKEKPEMALLSPGHGKAHGPDEALDCERLLEAMKIYVMGILSLSDIDLTVR